MESSLGEIFKKIDEKTLLLPDFQRDFKWSTQKQQSLLASILLNFPVGSSLILRAKSDYFASRNIGETVQLDMDESIDCEFLLDGQQRTTTLYNAFNNVFDFRNFEDQEALTEFTRDKANPMKVRWFIRIPVADKANQGITDIFSATDMLFNKETLNDFEPDDIIDVFSGETFNEKNNKGITTKWYSPYYLLRLMKSNKTSNQVITQFVNHCVDNGMLPIFMLGSNVAVINRVLDGIAEKNMQAIRDQYENNFSYIKKHYDTSKIFDGIDRIEDFEENGMDYSNELEKLFSNCKNDWRNNVSNYLVNDILEGYKISSLVTNDIRRAIPIFCHLNDGGMKLDDFDLVAAKVARKMPGDTFTYSLSSRIREMFANSLPLCNHLQHVTESRTGKLWLNDLECLSDGLPTGYFSKSILAICTILAERERFEGTEDLFEVKKFHTSSKTLLKLDTKVIRNNIEIATLGVQRAFAFLLTKCGVYNSNKLHYKLMIQPIAYVFSHDDLWDDLSVHKKIEYWYWSSAFSGRYLYDQSSVVIEDINQLYRWVRNGNGDSIIQRKGSIFNDDKYASKELLLQELSDSPKEGIRSLILQYILSRPSSYDLDSTRVNSLNSYSLNAYGDVILLSAVAGGLNDHHIIPLEVVRGLGQKTDEIRQDNSHILNSPLNRVLISAEANSLIRAMDPLRYFTEISENTTVMSSLLIGESLSKISPSSSEAEIKAALEERFDSLKASVYNHLIALLA